MTQLVLGVWQRHQIILQSPLPKTDTYEKAMAFIPQVLKVCVINLILHELVLLVHTHSFLTKPEPYTKRTKETANCRGASCLNACPEFIAESSITESSPSETWRRGQTVWVTWAKNNHHGGFGGFSLVPVAQIHNSSAHELLTVSHSCWETGLHRCGFKEVCGTDGSGQAYGTNIKVPLVFPDGVYVFRYVWYGGLHFKRTRGHFPDYKSCTFVRIRGGKISGAAYRPVFAAGEGKHIHKGRCETSADAIGQCPNLGCVKNRKMIGIPKRFRTGQRNQEYTRRDVLDLMGTSHTTNSDKSGEKHITIKADRICNRGICCPIQCGRCGGIDCQHLPGGKENCCTNIIRKAKRFCFPNRPPCVRRGYSRKK